MSKEDAAFLRAFKKRGELQDIADKAKAKIDAIENERTRLARVQNDLQARTLTELQRNLAALNQLLVMR